MTAPRCAYCEAEITSENQSREHILLNAIGGRKEVPNVFCRPCNSTFGDRWDSDAAQQLHFLSMKLEVVRDDGEIPACYYQTVSGKKVRLHPDGHMSLPPEKPVVIERMDRRKSRSRLRTGKRQPKLSRG